MKFINDTIFVLAHDQLTKIDFEISVLSSIFKLINFKHLFETKFKTFKNNFKMILKRIIELHFLNLQLTMFFSNMKILDALNYLKKKKERKKKRYRCYHPKNLQGLVFLGGAAGDLVRTCYI